MPSDSTEYFFISDLHIGGDGLLNECEFEPELITFLRELERHQRTFRTKNLIISI